MKALDIRVAGQVCELRVFEGASELVEYAIGDWRTLSRLYNCPPEPTDASFNGRYFSSWDNVALASRSLWPEGLAMLDQLLAEVHQAALPIPVTRRRRRRWSDDGDEVCLDRLRGGQEFFARFAREPGRGPQVVKIILEIGANCNRDAEAMLWRGAAGIVLVEMLEAAGFRCEVVAINYSVGTYGAVNKALVVNLKQPHEPLDRSTLVNVVSGWFYRTVGLANAIRSHAGRRAVDGLGQSRSFPQGPRENAGELAFVAADLWDRTAAVKFVTESLERLAKENRLALA